LSHTRGQRTHFFPFAFHVIQCIQLRNKVATNNSQKAAVFSNCLMQMNFNPMRKRWNSSLPHIWTTELSNWNHFHGRSKLASHEVCLWQTCIHSNM